MFLGMARHQSAPVSKYADLLMLRHLQPPTIESLVPSRINPRARYPESFVSNVAEIPNFVNDIRTMDQGGAVSALDPGGLPASDPLRMRLLLDHEQARHLIGPASPANGVSQRRMTDGLAPTFAPATNLRPSSGFPVSSMPSIFGDVSTGPSTAVLFREEDENPFAARDADSQRGVARNPRPPGFHLLAQEGFDRSQERAMAERRGRETGRDADAIYREMNLEPYQGPTELAPTHAEIFSQAQPYRPVEGTREWSVAGYVRYGLGENIFPFKDQWVRGYRAAINAAARQFDLPPALLAGVAYNEVGGDTVYHDRAAHALRRGAAADRTSFGNMSIQLRTAFEALGYDDPGEWQRRSVIASLEDPEVSIFIAAKVLSDLRNREFRDTTASRLSREQIEILGARYNHGSGIPRERLDRDYGRDITKRWRHLNNLLRGQ